MVQFWKDVHTPKDFAGVVIILFLATVAFLSALVKDCAFALVKQRVVALPFLIYY